MRMVNVLRDPGVCLLRRWSWCLPCGFDHLVPYFYVIYFAALLGENPSDQ